ncbi:hypothetical protein [Rubrivirga sp. IMCC43871]|uniref:hypothetical protein n=1 Tax=Rubrivirga sp. IMCC43871 TaxID=3391575 RepID=UPI00398FD2D8
MPTVVTALDGAVLQYWEVEESTLWTSARLPSDSAFVQYRARIEAAGAAIARPAQHVPEVGRGQEGWRRELHNVERAYSTEAGTLRPVTCLDALLFATQNARHAQLDHPTEFLASVLRRRVGGRTLLRVYFGAGDELFPPKAVYGFDAVERDVAAGWDYLAMLHNHTIQTVDGRVRLGVPAPSVSDVQLLNGLVERAGLGEAWVTNGFYTVVIPAADLPQYLAPE